MHTICHYAGSYTYMSRSLQQARGVYACVCVIVLAATPSSEACEQAGQGSMWAPPATMLAATLVARTLEHVGN